MKTKVDIISGFLGAGKTTLIKKLLEESLENEKLVIIENEFGQVGIDGSILKNTGIAIKEISSGCICCTLVGDFEIAILDVINKYKPDRIIIEPSGVGKLSDVIKVCTTSKLKDLLTINMLLVVVDVLKYQLFISNFGEFYENQIKNAKTIILSRTQKVDNKKLESITASIHKLNNRASIITTPWESLKAERILAVAEGDGAVSLEQQIRNEKKIVLKKPSHEAGCKCGCKGSNPSNHAANEVFDVWGIETPRIFSEAELRHMLEDISNEKLYGTVLRGKGIVQIGSDKWVQFDYVPGELEFKASTPDYSGRLCIIGSGLYKEKLNELFRG